ncbi:methionyl-tRNA formyltransferase [Lachnospiraceae bacterium 48-42]
MRVIFMGTPDIAVGTLQALAKEHEVVLAVTQPDKPKGRGGKMQYTPVKEAAVSLGIPVCQPKKIREPECVKKLSEYHADVMVVIAFGQILPKEILEMTPYGCINIHASLLPKYRGAAPIQWAVINGEKVSGVTTMQMDEGLDTGDILLKEEIFLEEKETGGSLHDKIAQCGAALCLKTLKLLKEGKIAPVKQGESPTEYARMLDKGIGNINWDSPAVSIERLIRGLNPRPSAYTHWNGKVMKIWQAEVQEGDSGREPGTVVDVEKDGFLVQTGAGLLKITELQIPGKKRMDAGAFLRGYTVEPGFIFKNIK